VSPPRQAAVVLRIYQPTPDATARAVEMLLRCDQGIKKAAHPGGPDDAERRSKEIK
jgi:hypothetical protein